jgi:hypothetical protein
MTRSREDERKRSARAHHSSAQPTIVQPQALCIIAGCLALRVGANLCAAHQAEPAAT